MAGASQLRRCFLSLVNGRFRSTASTIPTLSPSPCHRGLAKKNCSFICTRYFGFSLDPDFYEIPRVYGIPQGSKLMLYNLPSCDDREKLKKDLMSWLTELDDDERPTITNFEFTDDPEWNAKGVGAFVEFATKLEAATAYARRDASKFQGRYVRMDFVERKPFPPEWLAKNAKWFTGEYAVEGIVVPNSKVFVGNLPWSMDDAKLEELCAAHGTVYDAKVMKDRETGRSRGFGFVIMSNDDEMNAVIRALNGRLVDGRHLKANAAQNKQE